MLTMSFVKISQKHLNLIKTELSFFSALLCLSHCPHMASLTAACLDRVARPPHVNNAHVSSQKAAAVTHTWGLQSSAV